jgi:hypothetical protein
MERRVRTATLLAYLAIGTALALGLGGTSAMIGCVVDPTGGEAGDAGASSSSSSGDGGTPGAASGLVAIDADTLCTRLINECGQQAVQQDCINTFFPLRVTTACKSAIPTASCADLTSTTSSLSTTCFPPCSTSTAPVCNGDGTITLCNSAGSTQRKDCRDTCTAGGFTAWTGSCGKTYAGETAAQAQCWCR